jgi:hypothetical protein
MKNIKILIILLFLNLIGFAQNAEQNLKKYWYYRERLVKNFMRVGNCQGCSMPASIRGQVGNTVYQEANTLGWGDSPILLGEYVGILATEYALLKANNFQDVGQTLKELYYALEAFNRLDKTAESYFRSNHAILASDLNGFYIKDDVPADFVCSNYPLILNPGTSSAQYDITVCNDDNFKQFNSNIVPSSNPYHNPNTAINSVCGEYYYCYDAAHGNIAEYRLYPVEATIDQTLQFMVNLALICKSLPDFENYDGLAFSDGETSIRREAIAIARRLVLHLKNNKWQVKNPVTGFCGHGIVTGSTCAQDVITCLTNFDCGMSALIESYGLAKSMEYIDPAHHTDYNDAVSTELALSAIWDIVGNWPLCPVQSIPLVGAGQIVNAYNSLNPVQTLTINDFPSSISIEPCQELTKFLSMASIGDLWNDGLAPTTGAKIMNLSAEYNAGTPSYPLIHRYLHDKNYPILDSYYTDLLDEAPCIGPHKYFTTGTTYTYASYEWSCSDRLRHSEARGKTPVNETFNGEFSGIDYMLLFNLYCLNNGTYLADGGVGYKNLRDVKVDGSVPISVPPPVSIIISDFSAFDNIESEASILPNSVVNFRAGNFIHLGNGFHAGGGTNGVFHAYIDNYECSSAGSSGDYMRIANPSDSITNTPESVPYILGQQVAQTNSASVSQTTLQNDGISSNVTPKSDGEKNYSANNNLNLFTIQPNPNNGEFTVFYTNSKTENYNLTITNVIGETVHIAQCKDQKISLDLSTQPRGVYFVKVQGTNNVQVKKVVLN